MRAIWICGIGGLILAAGAATSRASKPSAFSNQSKPMTATVTVLALSSSSRQSFAGNQEVYLATVDVKGTREFARVIDQYPGFGLPIRPSLLRERTPLKMKVTREPECDLPGSQIFLTQGDAAIFDGSVRDSLRTHASDAIPCYKTLHQTIEIAKK
ncbi:hypothetical protein Terro_0828 [Terriglobus roseus DSM 18391]|uniref:Uncharacterized protein n=1 Tax=Terriglobus roseus (strain DSM 18391 / NRRL B-41598 / KBS 63) TaxID=926566 RepID=I3ZD37_TERRK|nr:hypothetical protein [Terriglobus roseus]AFL87155.1 hypothetical protein Terro_0828 [Terriglobus roseus DSM 18391]